MPTYTIVILCVTGTIFLLCVGGLLYGYFASQDWSPCWIGILFTIIISLIAIFIGLDDVKKEDRREKAQSALQIRYPRFTITHISDGSGEADYRIDDRFCHASIRRSGEDFYLLDPVCSIIVSNSGG